MYGKLKPHQAAQARRNNMKFFDSTVLASSQPTRDETSLPSYFAVGSFVHQQACGAPDSILGFSACNSPQGNNTTVNITPNGVPSVNGCIKTAKFGKLPININERNSRRNIKFFNSSEMGNENNKNLPGYFEVSKALENYDKSSPTTKLFF